MQVARYLLSRGLAGMEGVVYLSEEGRKMILLRAGLKVLSLAGCGVATHRRFTFFDQAHLRKPASPVKPPRDRRARDRRATAARPQCKRPCKRRVSAV